MDDDAVLQELGAELERDDPELAALLSGPEPPAHLARREPPDVPGDGPKPPHRHRTAWALLAGTVLGIGLLLAPAVTFGILAMLLVLASPLLACWFCAFPDDGPPPGRT